MRAMSSPASRTEAGAPAAWLASWFGCGRFPWAPGSAASALALAIAAGLVRYGGWRPWMMVLAAAALLGPAIWAAGRVAKAQGAQDPRLVVVDEVLGQWVALAGAAVLNWKSALAGFLLFRLFDIVKPPPVRQAEALPGGWGIVADDLAAGLYAALVLWLAGCFNLY